MPLFTYHAKDGTGQTVSGEVTAENERMAAGRIRDLGYFPLRVATGGAASRLDGTAASVRTGMYPQFGGQIHEEAKFRPYGSWFQRAIIFPIWTGVSLRELAIFYRQMAAMLNAGMSLSRCLTTMSEQSVGTLHTVVGLMNQHIQAGGSLSEAMAMFPHLFSDMQRSIVQAAEQTGALDVMMGRLSDYLESDYALRQLIKRETFLPKLQFAATFLLPTLVIAVVSGATAYFNAAVLPLLKIIGYLGIGFGSGRYALKTKSVALTYDSIKAFLPYFGTTVRMLALAKFSRALAALYSSGVSIPRAVETSARVAGNAYLANAMSKSVPAMMEGESLTASFARTGVFPPMFMSMIGTGETTGNLDEMMNKVAEFYEAESAVRLHQSVVSLNVLLTILMGIIVCITLVQFYMGNGYAGQMEQLMNDPN